MATWTGWEAQLIKALGVQDTREVGYLIRIWSSNTQTPCRSNPLAASWKIAGSGACQNLPGGNHAQNYPSHAEGIRATVAQLKSGSYPHLWAAIESGNPYNVKDPQAVDDDLKKWGAPGAGVAYLLEVEQGTFGSQVTGAQPVKAAKLHAGYADVRRSVNHNMPTALNNSRSYMKAGLRSVRRARKVRI